MKDLSGIEETFAQFAIPYDKGKVREFIPRYLCAGFVCAGRRAKGCGSVTNQVRAQSLADAQVVLMPGA